MTPLQRGIGSDVIGASSRAFGGIMELRERQIELENSYLKNQIKNLETEIQLVRGALSLMELDLEKSNAVKAENMILRQGLRALVEVFDSEDFDQERFAREVWKLKKLVRLM